MDNRYQYMNQKKIKLIWQKNIQKKHWNLENILYLLGGGEGVSQIHEKKVSIGTFSTFHHPLGVYMSQVTSAAVASDGVSGGGGGKLLSYL